MAEENENTEKKETKEESASSERGAAPETPKPKKKRQRRKRLKGFAGLLNGIMAPLNDDEKFKHVFRDTSLKVLLVATDMAPAGLVVIENGTLKIEEVPFKTKKDLKGVKRDGLLQCTLSQFMDIASGKLNPAKAWITRKIKIRGPKKLLKMTPVFSMVKI
ncbi:MAG: SCP2 sterol-binding domain-containing protein [Promethearchaeota archaeon]